MESLKMSQRRTTVPPTRVSSRSSSSGRSELIAGKKNEKQSAKKRTALDNRFYRTALDNRFYRTALDNRFYRTDHTFSRAARSARQHTTLDLTKLKARKRRATCGPRRLRRVGRPLC